MKKPAVNYHQLRQVVFEQSLLYMEAALGRKGSLIDLGAGHCTFSLIAHAMGWDVTALDVRSTRVPILPPGVRFIESDLNSLIWDPQDYDIIVCLGVYYHLDQQMQHKVLARCQGRPLIIDTHIANPTGIPSRYSSALSETYEKNGEIGADYQEMPKVDEVERKTSFPLASFDNPTSWWQTKESLLETLHKFGWHHVWTFNYIDMDIVQRTFFICQHLDEKSTGITGIRI